MRVGDPWRICEKQRSEWPVYPRVKLEVVVVAVDPGGVARIRLASGFGTLEDGVVIQTRTIITYDLYVYKN